MVKPCPKMIPKYSSSNGNKPYANVSWDSSNEYLLQTKVIRFFSWSVQTNPIQGPCEIPSCFLSLINLEILYIYVPKLGELNVENPRRAVSSPLKLGFSHAAPAGLGVLPRTRARALAACLRGCGCFLKWWVSPQSSPQVLIIF